MNITGKAMLQQGKIILTCSTSSESLLKDWPMRVNLKCLK